MIESVITIHRQHGEDADQFQTLPQHVFHTVIAAIFVIRSQSQHASCQRIHDISGGSFHDDVPRKIPGQRPAGADHLAELL